VEAAQEVCHGKSLAAGALQLRDAQGILAAAHVDSQGTDAQDPAGRFIPTGSGDELGAPQLHRLAGQYAAGAGNGVERADAPGDQFSRLRPVDDRLRLVDLMGVRHAFVRLPDRVEAALTRELERLNDELAA